MTPGLLVSLALLGLSAIDPVGLAAMPVLLTQKRPLVRSYTFLSGSLVALMAMGLLFAKGAGTAVLHFENAHAWLVPGVEVAAGAVLLVIAVIVFQQIRSGRSSVQGPQSLSKRGERFSNLQLFIFGAELVAIQSIVDVVFVVAMIRIGQLDLSLSALVTAVAAYAVPALVFQLAIVVAYSLSPIQRRSRLLAKIHHLLTHYANQTIIGVSLILGIVLVVNGLLIFAKAPHL